MAVDPSAVRIDLSRDDLLSEFTKQTYQERYMLPGEASPQHALARAAAAFADDVGHAQRLYDAASTHKFMFATPLLSNGGSERGLSISCFLNYVEDSREGIFDHYTETGWLSSVGGGVGAYWPLRSAGEKTTKGSSSTGVIPFQAVVDRLILAVSQGGTRRGSYASYLDITHPEIEEFITIRKTTGGDQNRKTLNLHNGVNITDAFMIAVRDDAGFNLTSPKTGDVVKTVRARDLWRLLIETRMQTGEPYMVFIDTMNRALPEAQKKIGLKVHQSNLCVAPYTQILTQTGYQAIGELADKTVSVWNGAEFTPVTVRRTSESAELVRVWFDDGDYLDCTPEHKFYLANGYKRSAGALMDGDELEYAWLPSVNTDRDLVLDADHKRATALAYTAGWATFGGFETNNRLTVYAPPDTSDDNLKPLLTASVDSEMDSEGGMTIRFEPKSIPAGSAPHHFSTSESLAWFQGVFAVAGSSLPDENEDLWWVVGSTDCDLIRDMRLLALGLGLHPRIRMTDTMHVFMLSPFDYAYLQKSWEVAIERPVKVVDVQPLPFRLETYCATEPKRGRLTLNGYVTGNCTEITLPTGRDVYGNMRTAVCCLSSVNLEKFEEWKDDTQFLEDMFRMLDNALSTFIDNAPPALGNAAYSAMRERSVGLGTLGFQAYLQSKGLAMDTDEASAINKAIFSYLRTEANRISLKLGEERGEAPDMQGTGERFAHKLAIAPNASSSILCGGTSPSIEPHRANAYLHKTLSGSFPVRNPYLVKALQVAGLDDERTWQSILAYEGSVQHLDLPEQVKNVFKTAPELDQMVLVRLAAERASYICQAQSLNLFFVHDASAAEITLAHYKAWELGVKSLYYLRSTTPKRAENTNTKVERIQMSPDAVQSDEGCISCEG